MFSFLHNDFVRKNAVASRILFLVVNLLGISPYNPNLKGAYKKLPVIYSVFLIAWFAIQILICFYFLLNIDLSIPIIMLLVQKVCALVPPILIITQALYCSGALKENIDSIIFADQCLHSAGIGVDFIKIEQIGNRIFLYFTVYTIIVLGLMVFLFVNTITTEFGYFHAILISIVFSSDILYSIYYTFHFCSVIMYFATRFQFLNKAMASMTESRRKNWIRLIRVKPHKKNQMKTTETIKFVHGVYRVLVKRFNGDCDLFITIQFLQSLLITTLSIYVLMCIQIGYHRFNDTDINIVLLFLSSIAHCFLLNVCSTIFCCTCISVEANCMEALVHNFMGETEEKGLLQMLEDFSLELFHEKIVYTACDFFTIDLSLFTKVAGAVVSYVVIFLQFGKFDYANIFHPLKNETDTSI